MAYLTTTDYCGFIASAIQPDRGEIDKYFKSLYREHEQDNKEDFFERLNNLILDLIKQFNKNKEDYINDMAVMLEIQRALSEKGETFLKKTLDSYQNLDWDKIHFFYENGIIWRNERQNSVEIFEFDIRNLQRGIEGLDLYLKSYSNQEVQKNNNVKLKWVGDQTQLYYLFHRLKHSELFLSNKYEDLAKFIIENFEGYGDKNLVTIKENIEKGKFPKRAGMGERIDDIINGVVEVKEE
jgi:hypothetical protein